MKKHSSDTQSRAGSASEPGVPTPASSAHRSAEKGLVRMFRSLRYRNYRLYWCGQMISLTGSSMQGIGQVWLVLELTHSAWQLGLTGALQALPILLFALFAGILGDRWPKRQVLLATQLAAMLQAFLLWLLIVTGTVALWQIYVLALLLGCTNCLYRPASQTFIVELVGYEDLPNAVALKSSLGQMTRIIGPGLGGVVIALSSVQLLFLLNAFSFLAMIASLLLLHNHELHIRAPEAASVRLQTWQNLREGLSSIWRTPAMFLVTVVVGLVLLCGSNFGVLLPLLATEVLHVGAQGFGFLSAAMGIGALLAALWLAWSNRHPTMRSVLIGMLLFGALEAALAFSHIYLLSAVLIACMSFAEEAFATQAVTALQIMVPDHLRGCATGVQILFFDGSLPPGYVLVGWLSGLYGAPFTLLICALLCMTITGVAWLRK
jgi:MFS family permease